MNFIEAYKANKVKQVVSKAGVPFKIGELVMMRVIPDDILDSEFEIVESNAFTRGEIIAAVLKAFEIWPKDSPYHKAGFAGSVIKQLGET